AMETAASSRRMVSSRETYTRLSAGRMPLPTGHSRFGSLACSPNGGSGPIASCTCTSVIASGARARLQPAPVPCRTRTSPASRRSPRHRRMITGFVFTLAATSAEVSTPRPRRSASASHASAWTATVIRLFAVTWPPRCNIFGYSEEGVNSPGTARRELRRRASGLGAGAADDAAHEDVEQQLEALLRVGAGELGGQRDHVREAARGQRGHVLAGHVGGVLGDAGRRAGL